ncbi:MAG: mechanosensitive ion channel [Planctomycetia bacterium]|nr:mechanosensitive ion channel [Planctomycetia bacterium]
MAATSPSSGSHALGAHVLRGLAGLVLVAVMADAPRAAAQDPSAPQPAQAGLSVDKVQERIKRIEESTELDAGLKPKVLDVYKQALDQLNTAEAWKAKAAATQAARARDPEELQKLKRQLEAAASEPAEATLDVPASASLTQLEQNVADAEQKLKAAQQNLAATEAEPKRRRGELPQLVAAAQQRLKEVTDELATLPEAGDSLDPAEARRAFLSAVKRAVEQELTAYDAERLRVEANADLITARQDAAALSVRQAEAAAKQWRELLNVRRKQEAVKQAEEARWALWAALPELKALAEKNAELTEQQNGPDGFPAKIAATTKEIEDLNNELAALRGQFTRVRDKIAAAGLTDEIGLLLQKHQADLPDLRWHRQRIRVRQAEIARVRAKLIELEDQRADLADLEPHVRRVMATVDPSFPPEQRHGIEQALRELLKARQGYLTSQIDDANTYINNLAIDLAPAERALVAEVEDYAHFINERILWVRSAPAISVADWQRAADGLARLADSHQWQDVLRELTRDARDNPGLYMAAAAALVPLVFSHRRLRRRIGSIDQQTSQAYAADIRPTIEVLLLTLLIAIPWPAVVGFTAWRMAAPATASLYAQNLAHGLRITAVLFLSTELVRQVCRRKGLGETHFGWHPEALARVRGNLRWVMLLGLPLGFIVAVVESPEVELHRSPLGRLAFVVGLSLLAVFAHRVLHPRRGVLASLAQREDLGRLWRQPHAWHLAATSGPLILAAIAALGYFYTALELTWRLQATAWLVLSLLLVQAIALRWLLVARRKLAIQQARERRAAAVALAQQQDPAAGEPAAAAAKPVDLVTIDRQTRRLLRSFVAVGAVLGCWLIWIDVLPALEIFNHWKLWPYSTEVRETIATASGQQTTRTTATDWITLGDAVLAGVIFVLTIIAGRNLPGLLEIAFLQRLPLDPGGRYAITTVSRYLITLVGLVLAFWMLGIGWANVQWLAAAMTVGLGFGLQEIFANLVSGLIILFERPLRVGDTVTVGGISGTVTRIRIRATTITDWDRKELIVPNREFITGQLVNWTLSDSTLRMVIKVGIAYGSDVALAQQLLLRVAHEEPRVLGDPAPVAVMTQFGDSTLDFELRVFVAGLDEFMMVRHDLNARIDRAFREAGIEIAFPQRDIHVRSVEPAVAALPRLVQPRKRAS